MVNTFVHMPASTKSLYAVLVYSPDVFFWHWPLPVRAEKQD